ncbi:hypothetical protein [Kitasatospora sp. MBT66]|uniref:hypothetical protein n=1 Tax=Kitasatospora sp. MBT66 TaxID=1444769 RepID=UPI0005B8CB23|nr:hypothetical protein [Kitasatospora sp. MBT66]
MVRHHGRKQTARRRAAAGNTGHQVAVEQLKARTSTAAHGTSPSAEAHDWDETVVAALTALVTDTGTAPMHTVWRDASTARGDSSRPPTQGQPPMTDPDRWGVAEACVDGYLVRQIASSHSHGLEKGTRGPVPYRTRDGEVEVAALWPLVHWPERGLGWRWVHNGWGVEQPGRILGDADPLRPAVALPFEVRVFSVLDGVLGEDYGVSAPGWETVAWCAALEHAAELAHAYTDHQYTTPKRRPDAGYAQAEVWEHAHTLEVLPVQRLVTHAAPDRPAIAHLRSDAPVPGRPASGPSTPEPDWRPGLKYPPKGELRVWDNGRWKSFAWFTGAGDPGIAAALLRVGAGGRYPYAESWRPRHPDTWRHDWTQEGRSLSHRYPAEPYTETARRSDRSRRRRAEHLAASLAGRSGGRLTVEQAADRIRRGGQQYEDFLRTGQVVVLDVLNAQRLALPEGLERDAVRALIDGLEDRHEVPGDLVPPAWARLDQDERDGKLPGMRAYRARALTEYLTPAADGDGLPGLAR